MMLLINHSRELLKKYIFLIGMNYIHKIPKIINRLGVRNYTGGELVAAAPNFGIAVGVIGSITASILYFDSKFENKFNNMDVKFNTIDKDIKELKVSVETVLTEIKKK